MSSHVFAAGGSQVGNAGSTAVIEVILEDVTAESNKPFFHFHTFGKPSRSDIVKQAIVELEYECNNLNMTAKVYATKLIRSSDVEERSNVDNSIGAYEITGDVYVKYSCISFE